MTEMVENLGSGSYRYTLLPGLFCWNLTLADLNRYILMMQALSICGICFELNGPANTTVVFFDYGANITSTYQLQLTWDPAYLGPLMLELVPPLR